MSFLPVAANRSFEESCDFVRRTLGSVSWKPAVTVSRSAVRTIFSRMTNGQLYLRDQTTGTADLFGDTLTSDVQYNGKTESIRVELRVMNESFWVRLLLFADMGFAEAHMLGEVECDDLTGFFKLFILNRDGLGNATTWASSMSSAMTGLARRTNTLSNALLNVSAHYDISNDMFSAFLSKDMTYSCAIWQPISQATEETLEDAQMTKLHRFIDGACIKASDHVLEIGTGWGSFAIEAVRRTGCRVTSLTLSIEQKHLAEKRILAAGYAGQIDVQLMDYRALPVPDVPYDKVISIEMLEAVGREFLESYFRCVHRLLKPNGGIAMFQCITMPECRYESYARGEDFIRKYIFPGGHLPSISQLISSVSKGSDGTLIVERVENIGGHYTKTLRMWRENFAANFDSRIRPALMAQHKSMTASEVDVFRRKWEYYFTYCEAGFATKTLGDVIITVAREGAMELMKQIPL